MEILSIAPPAGFPAQLAASPALPQRVETPASEASNAPSEQVLSKLRGSFVRIAAAGGAEGRLIDAIDHTFGRVLSGLRGGIGLPAGEQEVRPAEIDDLRRLQAYLTAHGDETHPFDLSDEIKLSPHSPMPGPNATVEQVMGYYRDKYPQLSLPDPPKTISELVSYNKILGTAIHANQGLTDAIDQAFEAVLGELTGKIDYLTDRQEVRQAEILDLRHLQVYLTAHSDETHPFGLSDEIKLSPHSPMLEATATVEQVIVYYRDKYPQLSLSDPPKTIPELISCNKALGDAIQLTLAPGSRLSMVALQDYVSRLHAIRDFQGAVYRALYDIRKQYVRGM